MRKVERLYDSALPDPDKHALGGNMASRRLLLVPPLREAAYAWFAQTFKSAVKENVEDHFLLVPLVATGDRASKANTGHLADFIKAMHRKMGVRFAACLGGEPFKHVFGRGYKPPMSSLAGNMIYLPREFGQLRIFVFPNAEPIGEPPHHDEGVEYRRAKEELKARRSMQAAVKKYATLK